MAETVLVTGGAGYIGSTICSALEDAGHIPVIVDSMVAGRPEFVGSRYFYQGDIADPDVIGRAFDEHPDIRFAIHCAALAKVPDSVLRPAEYYRNNVSGSLELFEGLAEYGCRNIIFSSSASIYDTVSGFMVTETSPLKPKSPYARSKLMAELVLEDMAHSRRMRVLSLRYFNPIGADPKMRSGQTVDNASHIVGMLTEVATGQRPRFQVTGTEWPTRDGTGIRDYVHVWDLALAHVSAVERMEDFIPETGGFEAINLGTGMGVTVREMVAAFERVHGAPIPQEDSPPRPGDVAGAYASGEKANRLLRWRPTLTVEDGIRHALEWAGRDRGAIDT